MKPMREVEGSGLDASGRERVGAPALSPVDYAKQWLDARPDLDTRSVAVIGDIYSLGQAIEKEFRLFSQREFGLGPGDLRILLALRRAPGAEPLRATDLFQSLLVTSGAVTKQVDRLERQGFVTRELDPQQRKQRRISLTQVGKATADKAVEHLAANFQVSKVISAFPSADLDLMIAMLGRMRSA